MATSFPQPARPTNILDSRQDSDYNVNHSETIQEDGFLNYVSDHDDLVAEEDHGWKETLEELLRSILELYEKLPASLRSKLNLEGYLNNVPKDYYKREWKENSSNSSPDVSGLMEELSRKLERFKIRTVQPEGVVKEEEDE